MNFKFFMISIILIVGFVGSAFAQTADAEKDYTCIPEHYDPKAVDCPVLEFSTEEIQEMKNKGVLITMNDGSFMIELFPEDAPNTVHNFLKLVESGYYDGIVFHRIIPGFMIQAGDPNTKDPESDRSLWGTNGPGYFISAEFNPLQHDRGIVSMARSTDPDSAGSQFFIVHQDANHLDGQYTAFGRLVPGTHSIDTLDIISWVPTDERNAPRTPDDVTRATIQKAVVLDPFTATGFGEPDRNQSYKLSKKIAGGFTENYINSLHDVSFDLPYRWNVIEGTGDYLNLLVEPTALEHNTQVQIDETGFTPQILVFAEERDPMLKGSEVGPEFFSISGGEDPKVLSNYLFENEDGMYGHITVSTQNLQTGGETVQFKIIQLHFTNYQLNYSVVYVNLTEWFRYEINSFDTLVKNFEIMKDGVRQPINFAGEPIFKMIVDDAKTKPLPESLPPARVGGGCLIATASYGSELAPQVQYLREIRDSTILQTQSGSAFMKGFNQFYYSFSPMIADYERENPAFKEAVKLVITPLLTSLTLLQYVDIDSEPEMLGYGIGIILLNIGMYFIAPAVLIMKIRSFYKLQ